MFFDGLSRNGSDCKESDGSDADGSGNQAGRSVGPGDAAEGEDRRGHGLDATGAEQLEVAVVGRAQADVGDMLAVAAMLDDEIGAAGDGQRTNLGNIRGIVERAGRDGFIEQERFFFELERGDDHALRVGRCRLRVNGRNGEGHCMDPTAGDRSRARLGGPPAEGLALQLRSLEGGCLSRRGTSMTKGTSVLEN